MHCFARIVRACLGSEALAEQKLEFGTTLVVLGVSISPTELGFKLLPAKKKADKCVMTINEVCLLSA